MFLQRFGLKSLSYTSSPWKPNTPSFVPFLWSSFLFILQTLKSMWKVLELLHRGKDKVSTSRASQSSGENRYPRNNQKQSTMISFVIIQTLKCYLEAKKKECLKHFGYVSENLDLFLHLHYDIKFLKHHYMFFFVFCVSFLLIYLQPSFFFSLY